MIPDTYRIKKNNKYISMHRTKMKCCAQIPHNGPISRVISPLIALILIDSLFLFIKSLRELRSNIQMMIKNPEVRNLYNIRKLQLLLDTL